MGLAKIATCLFKKNQNIFLSFPFDLLSSLSYLSMYLSIIFIPLCAYLFPICLDLPLHWLLHLFVVPLPLTPSGEFFCSHGVLFLAFICLFLFSPFPFLDPVLPVPPQLLTLNGSVYKLHISYPALSGHSRRIFLVSIVTFC